MFWLIRKLLFIPAPKISKAEAVRLACVVADEKGWVSSAPKAIEELRTWMVWLNSDQKGGPFVVIDQQTGETVHSGCPLR